MEYWTVIPSAVRKSKRLSAEEKELWYEIKERVNAGGYCTLTNEELAKALNVSPKTITLRLASLQAKQFASITFNVHSHRRWIFPKIPYVVSEEKKPQRKELEEKTKNLQEGLKKAIVFGTIDFNVLIQKLKESPYLDEVEDNSTQFILTTEQMEFLINFKRRYPGKNIDCQVACYPLVDYQKLIHAIEDSFFMQGSNNLSLKWCLSHAEEIINGKYKTCSEYASNGAYKKNFTEREYAPGDLDYLFRDIDDIII